MRVIYATDGSGPSREGQRLILALFDPRKVTIHAFSVTPEPTYIPDPLLDPYELERLDAPPVDAGAIAKEAMDHLIDGGFTCSSGTARGNPAVEILREMDANHYDLVVLGAGHSTWLGNTLLGSVSTHVLHHASSSVLVAHHAPSGQGRVLIGVDGSEGSMIGARTATDLLDPERSRLYIRTSVEEPFFPAMAHPPGPPFVWLPKYEKVHTGAIERGWEIVERACATLKPRGFSVEGAVLSGSAGPQLLKEADNLSVDLVVVGSRGLGLFKRTLLGSVSDQVVRHARATLVAKGEG